MRWLPSASSTWVDNSLHGGEHRNRDLLKRILRERGDDAAWDELKRDYEAQSTAWREWTEAQTHYLSALTDALQHRMVGPRALEVGTGTGEASPKVAQRADRFVASDVSRGMIHSYAHRFPLVVADVRALPFASGSFDTVVGLNCVPGFREFNRVLSRNGAILLVESFAEHTPLHVPPEVTASSLGRGWDVTARRVAAGQWVWAVRV